jgi:DNA ligase-1
VRRFAELYLALDQTTQTSRKVDALRAYFSSVPAEDAAWALHFLSGRRIKRVLPYARLVELACARASLSEWLFSECLDATGDLGEACALVLPATTHASSLGFAQLVEERVLPLRALDDDAQRALVTQTWDELGANERLVFNKVLTGAFRVGVSELLVLRAIEKSSRVPSATLKHRTMGDWTPSADFWRALTSTDSGAAATQPDRPYPFALAHPLDPLEGPAPLGPVDEWQIEWKWDGIRGQLVRRDGVFLWSRGEELVTSQFPEIADAAQVLPKGTVLDGEVLPWKNGVLGFGDLQRRLNRKVISEKLRDEVPIVFLAYDILEHQGVDVRALPIVERRALLDAVLDAHPHERLRRSTPIASGDGATWESLTELRKESRARNVEGFMLKRRSSPYGVGRKRGDWWKWKIDPYTVDAVLVYAQGGSGKRASLFSDYTFAVWTAPEDDPARTLVTFAKAYSGLTDDEIKEVDAFVRKNTTEKFGPVRHVKPELVFEIGFEGIAESKRHKSGVAVRFPRMLRWRKDKPAAEADTVDALRALLR